jgi:hypothetical protein
MWSTNSTKFTNEDFALITNTITRFMSPLLASGAGQQPEHCFTTFIFNLNYFSASAVLSLTFNKLLMVNARNQIWASELCRYHAN